ncbi:receptor-transporting protein 4-like [Sciurus carolinensis]|uniref:receptor-transporting protein 4-like n=1 Tax=Sciurus carolinensis TaxID=30640 RepID=UPI001FB35CF3|nr:receptor-transporting protein 4-like [Sciurus carolinensis]
MYLDISTWEQTFQSLIQQEEPWAKWTLKLDENIQPGGMARGWRQYLQRAFGREYCSEDMPGEFTCGLVMFYNLVQTIVSSWTSDSPSKKLVKNRRRQFLDGKILPRGLPTQ